MLSMQTKKILAHLLYLLILFKVQLSSEYVLKLDLRQNMPKITPFLSKNRKNLPALGALRPDPMPPAAGGCARRPLH